MILYKKGGDSTYKPEYEAMSKVLTERNKDLPWIKRYKEGNKKNILQPDGKRSTHRLSAEVDGEGNWYVFPNIIELENGQLREMGNYEAMDYARKNNTAITTRDKGLALYYAKNGLIDHRR